MHKKSFLARCQSVDPKLTPLLNNLVEFCTQRIPLSIIILALVKLSSKYIEMRDDEHVRKFIRVYYKGKVTEILILGLYL